MNDVSPSTNGERRTTGGGQLRSVIALFLKMGFTAFGGPAAHIGMFEDEVVVRRRWLTRQEFLDLLSAANLIPGPNSTEMAIYVGHRQAGWPGLIAAGSCFILPATLMVAAIAWAYVRFGNLPQLAGILYGVKPVVMAVIVQALWRLGRTALKTRFLAGVAVAAAAANWLWGHELIVLFAAGAVVAIAREIAGRRSRPGGSNGTNGTDGTNGSKGTGKTAGSVSRGSLGVLGAAPLISQAGGVGVTGAAGVTVGVAATGAAFGLWPLFLFFLKVGAVLFGSGYVLLAFLQADLVGRWHWLTQEQLLDAIAVGQVTPGPLFTTATFVGFILGSRLGGFGGPLGAAVATLGIFLPAFFYVAISGPIIPRLRRSPTAAAVLDGVNVGSLALMAVVSCQLARGAVCDLVTAAMAAASAILLIRFRVNSAWLALGGALIGLLAHSLFGTP